MLVDANLSPVCSGLIIPIGRMMPGEDNRMFATEMSVRP